MIMQILSFLCASLCILGISDAAQYPALTQQETADFHKQLDQLTLNAEKRVQELQDNASRRDLAPTWNSKLELENAIVQLEVKKTLISNFKNTESLRSPLVREALVNLLNKPIITTTDLAQLQTLVINEKAKIHAETMQANPMPTPH